MDFLEYLKNFIDFVEKKTEIQSELINKIVLDKTSNEYKTIQYNNSLLFDMFSIIKEKISEIEK